MGSLLKADSQEAKHKLLNDKQRCYKGKEGPAGQRTVLMISESSWLICAARHRKLSTLEAVARDCRPQVASWKN